MDNTLQDRTEGEEPPRRHLLSAPPCARVPPTTSITLGGQEIVIFSSISPFRTETVPLEASPPTQAARGEPPHQGPTEQDPEGTDFGPAPLDCSVSDEQILAEYDALSPASRSAPAVRLRDIMSEEEIQGLSLGEDELERLPDSSTTLTEQVTRSGFQEAPRAARDRSSSSSSSTSSSSSSPSSPSPAKALFSASSSALAKAAPQLSPSLSSPPVGAFPAPSAPPKGLPSPPPWDGPTAQASSGRSLGLATPTPLTSPAQKSHEAPLQYASRQDISLSNPAPGSQHDPRPPSTPKIKARPSPSPEGSSTCPSQQRLNGQDRPGSLPAPVEAPGFLDRMREEVEPRRARTSSATPAQERKVPNNPSPSSPSPEKIEVFRFPSQVQGSLRPRAKNTAGGWYFDRRDLQAMRRERQLAHQLQGILSGQEDELAGFYESDPATVRPRRFGKRGPGDTPASPTRPGLSPDSKLAIKDQDEYSGLALSPKERAGRGIKNPDNRYCFLISAVQLLSSFPKLSTFLRNWALARPPRTMVGPLMTAIGAIINTMADLRPPVGHRART
eukprot:g25196.t1